MAPESPSRVIATQAWFIKANEDLREAQFVLSADPPFIGSSLFHSQQAVEKALKGFLAWHERGIPTDDLEQLRELCADVDGSMSDILRGVENLTEFAFRFRYPNDLAEPTFDQATVTLHFATTVVAAVLSRVVADAQRPAAG